MQLNVSNVKVRMTASKDPKEPIAWASCVVDNSLSLSNIAIHENKKDGSFRLVYPAKKSSSGKKYYFYNPTNEDTRLALEDAILDRFEEMLEDTKSRKR